jgi:hypothetical protein
LYPQTSYLDRITVYLSRPNNSPTALRASELLQEASECDEMLSEQFEEKAMHMISTQLRITGTFTATEEK